MITSRGGLGLALVMLNTVPSAPLITRQDASTPGRAHAATETFSPGLGAASADDDVNAATTSPAVILSALIARLAFWTAGIVPPAARHDPACARQNGISSSMSPRLPAAASAGFFSRVLGPEEPKSPPLSSEPKSPPPPPLRSPALSSMVSCALKPCSTTSVV